MAQGDVTITVVGGVVREPELRYTPQGSAVCNFTVASTPRYLDKASGQWKDGEPLFLRCNVWQQAAENVAESLSQGARVIVTGRLRQRQYEKDGQKRTSLELEVDEIGPSLRYATAKVQKMSRSSGSSGGGYGATGGQGDPWATGTPGRSNADSQRASFDDEPPF